VGSVSVPGIVGFCKGQDVVLTGMGQSAALSPFSEARAVKFLEATDVLEHGSDDFGGTWNRDDITLNSVEVCFCFIYFSLIILWELWFLACWVVIVVLGLEYISPGSPELASCVGGMCYVWASRFWCWWSW